MTHVSGITYYLSATINPILYSILSLKFRGAFKDTLEECSCKSNSKYLASKFRRESQSSARFTSIKSTFD